MNKSNKQRQWKKIKQIYSATFKSSHFQIHLIVTIPQKLCSSPKHFKLPHSNQSIKPLNIPLKRVTMCHFPQTLQTRIPCLNRSKKMKQGQWSQGWRRGITSKTRQRLATGEAKSEQSGQITVTEQVTSCLPSLHFSFPYP